jgi:hypothetical protein
MLRCQISKLRFQYTGTCVCVYLYWFALLFYITCDQFNDRYKTEYERHSTGVRLRYDFTALCLGTTIFYFHILYWV